MILFLRILVEGVLRSFRRNSWVLGGRTPPSAANSLAGGSATVRQFFAYATNTWRRNTPTGVFFGVIRARSTACAFYHSNPCRFRVHPRVTCMRIGQGLRRPPALCDSAAVSAGLVGGRPYLCLRGRAARRGHLKCPVYQGVALGCVNYLPVTEARKPQRKDGRI